MNDPYIDPASGVLRNKLGITSEAQLSEAVSDYASEAQVRLTLSPPRPTGDEELLKAIHKRLFGRVFDWAGQFRIVQLSKGVDPADLADYFFDARFLDNAMYNLHENIQKQHYLKDLDHDHFCILLARFYAQLNYIHPFREGNGRTQRVFWTIMSFNAGWNIDWEHVSKHQNDTASLRSYTRGDMSGLEQMFLEHVSPAVSHQPHIWTRHLLNDSQKQRERKNYEINR